MKQDAWVHSIYDPEFMKLNHTAINKIQMIRPLVQAATPLRHRSNKPIEITVSDSFFDHYQPATASRMFEKLTKRVQDLDPDLKEIEVGAC